MIKKYILPGLCTIATAACIYYAGNCYKEAGQCKEAMNYALAEKRFEEAEMLKEECLEKKKSGRTLVLLSIISATTTAIGWPRKNKLESMMSDYR